MEQISWRVRRAALGLRQRDVADRAAISQAQYSVLERGETVPTARESEAIERALELPDSLRELYRADALAEEQKPKSSNYTPACVSMPEEKT